MFRSDEFIHENVAVIIHDANPAKLMFFFDLILREAEHHFTIQRKDRRLSFI
jgi:hypothetical protein